MGCKSSAAFSVQACQSGAKRKRPPMTEGDEWSKAWQGDTTEEYRSRPAGLGPDLGAEPDAQLVLTA